jgi:hypothetical protein
MSADPRYLAAHRKLRKELLPRAYGTRCIHCGYVMLEGMDLDLDNVPGTDMYRGIVHAKCNHREGAIRGNKLRGLRRHSIIFPSWGRKGS